MQSVWTLALNSVLLGFGLAMDAFSVSLVNGLREPDMTKSRMAKIAGVFGGFQLMMPMIGWICVRTILEIFKPLTGYIPEGQEAERIGTGGLMAQGVATSIDALSVGFTMTELNWIQALAESTMIGAVTFGICMGGILIGRKAGTKISNKAGILGGLILIAIGIKIVVSGQ